MILSLCLTAELGPGSPALGLEPLHWGSRFSGLQAQTRTCTVGSPDSLVFRRGLDLSVSSLVLGLLKLDWKYTTGFLGSPACR